MKLSRFPLWPAHQAADPASNDEGLRNRVIAAYGADAVQDDRELAQIVEFAARLCEVPIAMVTLVEKDRQRFLARKGFPGLETPRSTSLCAHTMEGQGPLVVPDASEDARFAEMELVKTDDGVRFYAGQPLVSSEGVPLGALCVIDREARPEGLNALQREGLEVLGRAVMRRLTAERDAAFAENRIEVSELRTRQLAENLPVYAWAANAEGEIEYANPALYEFLGVDDLSDFDSAALVHPDDIEELRTARTVSRASKERWEAKARLKRNDGVYRWMILRAWPFVVGDEDPQTWFGAAVDIDDLQSVSDSRDLLARELSHRIKNIFAVISGLISLQGRKHPGAEDFVRELSDTIRTLGKAHDFVRPHAGRTEKTLNGLLAELLAPYGRIDGKRIGIIGSGCAIGEKSATPLALIFHELATNSAKYGALSHPDGHLAVEIIDEGSQVVVAWRETGLPESDEAGAQGAPDTVEREGFGSRLLRTAVEGQLQGKFTRRIVDGMLEVDLELPCDKLQA